MLRISKITDYGIVLLTELARGGAGGLLNARELAESAQLPLPVASKALKVWQPDASWVGGMTVMRDIFALGQANGIWVVPHRGSEVWGLHAILALADTPLAEAGRPWVTWVEGAPTIEQGTIHAPRGPGFGVTFDEALLVRPDRAS